MRVIPLHSFPEVSVFLTLQLGDIANYYVLLLFPVLKDLGKLF